MTEGTRAHRSRTRRPSVQMAAAAPTVAALPAGAPVPPVPAVSSGAAAAAPASAVSLPAFDPYAHLLSAFTGPGPLCLLLDQPPEAAGDEDPAAAAEEEHRPKVLAPVCLRFIDDQFNDMAPPPGFFERPPRGTPAAQRKRTPMFYLQHVLHAILYHRAFEAPVAYESIRVYAARRDLPQEHGATTAMAGSGSAATKADSSSSSLAALYDGLARQHGAELYESRVEKGTVAASYYHFAVQMVGQQPSTSAVATDGAVAAAAPGSAPTATAATAPTAAAVPVAPSRKRASARSQQQQRQPQEAATPVKEPQRGRKRKAAPAAAVAATAADADDADVIDLTVAGPAAASSPNKKQQRPRASKEVLRRVVQRKRLVVE